LIPDRDDELEDFFFEDDELHMLLPPPLPLLLRFLLFHTLGLGIGMRHEGVE